MMGGNKNTRAYGWYESPSAGRVWLESSYEFKVAVDLDKNNVNWIRPKFLLYDTTKKYFPDFYLSDFNIYLDPKNDFLIKQDANKIKSVMNQNNVIVLVLSKNKLSWEKILNEIKNNL